MPYIHANYTVTFSAGASASPARLVAGAESILIAPTSTATSTGGISTYHVEVADTDTGSLFYTLSTSAWTITTGKTAVQVSPVAFRQIRIGATAADSSSMVVGMTAQILV